jgi:hypothetical protein
MRNVSEILKDRLVWVPRDARSVEIRRLSDGALVTVWQLSAPMQAMTDDELTAMLDRQVAAMTASYHARALGGAR